MMIRVAKERGRSQSSWLNSYHSFSFADYYDPSHMGFSVLRVINEDVIQPDSGFGMHAHQDMEIITYVISGELVHKDSMGNGSIIKPGEIQRMSAGTGVKHSEFNASTTEPLHLLQIWIIPDQQGLMPSYEQKLIAKTANNLSLIASSSPAKHAVLVHQDIHLHLGCLNKNSKLSHTLNKPSCWIQLISGSIECNGKILQPGDGLALKNQDKLMIQGLIDSEFLLFELP
jgi:redox-sensitive bicupin YhaK (pirin superfamily)